MTRRSSSRRSSSRRSSSRRSLPTGLYAMADAGWGDPVAIGGALFELGCAVVQLRAKGWSSAERTAAARALQVKAQAHDALLVVNDDLRAAVASGAGGLHLGQEDGPLAAARARLGPEVLVGRSTHDLAQVDQAVAEGADYLGFGPVFATQTKALADPTVGLELLAAAVARSTLPIVAIGGIDRARLAAVQATGVHSWAVVSDLLQPWRETLGDSRAGKAGLARRVLELAGPAEGPLSTG